MQHNMRQNAQPMIYFCGRGLLPAAIRLAFRAIGFADTPCALAYAASLLHWGRFRGGRIRLAIVFIFQHDTSVSRVMIYIFQSTASINVHSKRNNRQDKSFKQNTLASLTRTSRSSFVKPYGYAPNGGYDFSVLHSFHLRVCSSRLIDIRT